MRVHTWRDSVVFFYLLNQCYERIKENKYVKRTDNTGNCACRNNDYRNSTTQLQKEILLHHKLLGKIQLVRITEMILTLKNLLR
jgi:hypothetical protein